MFHVKHPQRQSKPESSKVSQLSKLSETPLAREIAQSNARWQTIQAARVPSPGEARVFTVSNQKGGVGKTTTAVNLAAALARKGLRVLLIDLDPQGNASTAVGVDHQRGIRGTYEVLTGKAEIKDVVVQTPEHENLWCLPATIDLASAELELFDARGREFKLRDSLRRYLKSVNLGPHYVFIDSPPSLSLLTMNGLSAATEVLVPVQCEYYALEGLALLLSHIEKVQQKMNPGLRLSTLLLTMFDARTRLSTEVADEVRKFFPKETLKAVIPRAVKLSEAPSFRQSGVGFDSKNLGSLAYYEAAIELAKRGAPKG